MNTPKLALSLLLVCAVAGRTVAQTADQLIAKHILAMGGEEKWKNIKSLVLEGSIGQGGFSVGLKQTIVNGKGMRMDISAGGQTGYMIVTRDSGWTYMPFMGQEAPQQIPQEDIKMGRDKINFLYSQLLDKTQIESAKIDGKDTIEGNACTRLTVKAKDGNKLMCFIDNKTYYLRRMVTTIVADGEEHDVAVQYNDFKKLASGVTVPASWVTPQGAVNFTNIEVNVPVDDAVFRP